MKETKQAVASPEGRAAMHELMGAFEAFKATNDQRLAEIETKRAADPLLDEKLSRMDATMQDTQRRIDRLAAEARRPALGASTATGAAAPDPRAEERKSAWDGYLKGGATAGLELKGLAETAPSTGGYIAPPETERAIERRLMTASPMRDIAGIQTIGSSVYAKPVSIAGVAAGWAAETAPRLETPSPTLALLEFPAADLYACPAATQALLDDAFTDLNAWLAAECEDAFAAQETAAFVSGDGVNKPMGFLSYPIVADAAQLWSQLGYVATGAAASFATDNPVESLIDLMYAPLPRYRAQGRFVMNRRTTATVRKFKDTDGNYIWSPSGAAGQPATLLGYPVTEVETMPDGGANATPVAFGDFAKGYLIVDRAGVRVLRDPFTAKPYVLFYTTKRVGGGVQNFDAIKLLKFAAS